ncbi:paralysed flagella protein B [Campylobacter iguaniorum]|uniref:tetratricopeptide repeat protein n=1 Tax=Campylobacter iguaniorum TaxID=1244531 RepID=UPI0007C8AF47|nr:tetratricopeptide repeat protein [Campylobacter iguaniorum]ANE36306.1 paralysed flagella protein B [Campylobacter iguaniorum]
MADVEQTKDDEVVILQKDEEQKDEGIIPLEELDKKEEVQPEIKDEEKPKSKLIIFGAAGASLLIFIIIILIFALRSSDSEPKMQTTTPTEPKQTITQKFNPSKIDDLIKKANSLYESGNKFEALKIYENIAIYNEALSNYNLGVSQMNQGRFQEAIESFKKAIENQENTSASALNAAISALELKNNKLFKYYIDIAGAFLSQESDSVLYDHYNALINFYKGYYIEALYILDSMGKDKYYENQKNYIKSKILSYIYQDKDAIKSLELINGYNPNLPLGLLYARTGQYDTALKHLNKALVDEKNQNLIKLAISLVNIKIGNFESAALNLKSINDQNQTFITATYPIKAILKPDFFDIDIAQKNFSINTFFDTRNVYEMLFYFAPYKVFDAKQTIDYIRKGGISAFVDENAQADEYLKTSSIISKVNLNISKTIAKALNYDLREANKEFLDIINIYSGHSILHYNLALTYAQLGNFAQAYKHFITSYHLDPSNYLSGVFAITTSSMIGKTNAKLIEEVLENLNQDGNIEPNNIYEAIIQLVLGNKNVLLRWLENDKSEQVLDLSFASIIAHISGLNQIAIQKTEKLKEILPNDIITNILYFTTRFTGNNIKEYAKNVQYNYFSNNLNSKSFYGGPNIVRVQYIKLLQIAGLLDVQRDKIKADLDNASSNYQNIMQTLAYIDLFTRNYEESYTIYNELINKYEMNDANTLFLASVASIGANHPESAIGYIRLSKIIDPTSVENIIALALLYQEVGNIDAAVSQYNILKDNGYQSKFFTFKLLDPEL